MEQPSASAPPLSVLVIDDDPALRETLVEYLTGRGFECHAERSGEGGLYCLARRPYDLVITDLRMPGIGGLDVVRLARERRPDTEVVVITGYATLQDGIEAMRQGAWDFIVKPLQLDHFEAVLGRCAEWVAHKRSNQELREVNRRLLELNQLKSRFLAITDHELRTPVAVLDGMIQVLARRAQAVPDDLRPRLADLCQVSHRLVELVRGIHDLAQCRTHGLPVNLDWCEAAEVAASVELDFRLAGFERSLDLRLLQEVPAAFRFRADLRRLRQAVSELVQNAVKATPDGGRVAVTLSAATGDGGRQFVVTVADTGVGIPPEEHARIFEAFYELGDERHHHTSKHEFGGSGLGLGLSLALETARAHGGGIRVDSRPGEGAIFSLWIALEGTPSEP